MNPTIKDVAREAGVSTATVSRVVNNDARISPATRHRVEEVIARLNYKVNTVARSLKNKKTLSVGLITPEIANVFFMRIAAGVEDRLAEDGYSMIVFNSRESRDGERRAIDLLLDKQVDGAIIIPAGGTGDHYGRLREVGVPTVLVDRLVTGFESDAVLVDNEEAVYRAIVRLVEMGRRRFGFIGGQPGITTAQERFRGFARALEDCGCTVEETLVRTGDFHTESGYELFADLMGRPDPPQTVVIANYFMQVGALRYAAHHRDRLPEDLFIASFDNSEIASVAGIPGISIAQPINDIGRRGAEILLERIGRHQHAPFRIERLATRIVTHGGHEWDTTATRA